MFDTREGEAHRILVLGRLNELMKRWVTQVSIEKVSILSLPPSLPPSLPLSLPPSLPPSLSPSLPLSLPPSLPPSLYMYIPPGQDRGRSQRSEWEDLHVWFISSGSSWEG